MFLDKGLAPRDIQRLETITDLDHQERSTWRVLLSTRFAPGPRESGIGSHNSAYSRVRTDGQRKTVRSFAGAEAMRVKYGPTSLPAGARCRRLIEAGVRSSRWPAPGGTATARTSKPTSSWFRSPITSCRRCLDDLADRGFGSKRRWSSRSGIRPTPQINPSLGRDHFASAWSASLSGVVSKGERLRQDR